MDAPHRPRPRGNTTGRVGSDEGRDAARDRPGRLQDGSPEPGGKRPPERDGDTRGERQELGREGDDETLLRREEDVRRHHLGQVVDALPLWDHLAQEESVKNWTEMVTTQIFFGAKDMTPDSFQAR